MARPIEFDPVAVLDAVTDTFLTHGYAGTSVAMLAEATGLGKQSLYNAFGDKPALYTRALARAAERSADGLAVLQRTPCGRSALHALFDALVADCASGDPTRRHCIVSSGLLEGIDDAGVQRALARGYHETWGLFRALVVRGQGDGSIRTDRTADQLADHLMSAMSGLRIAARAGTPADRLGDSAALALSLLPPPTA